MSKSKSMKYCLDLDTKMNCTMKLESDGISVAG
jgi:hypothetical protein